MRWKNDVSSQTVPPLSPSPRGIPLATNVTRRWKNLRHGHKIKLNHRQHRPGLRKVSRKPAISSGADCPAFHLEVTSKHIGIAPTSLRRAHAFFCFPKALTTQSSLAVRCPEEGDHSKKRKNKPQRWSLTSFRGEREESARVSRKSGENKSPIKPIYELTRIHTYAHQLGAREHASAYTDKRARSRYLVCAPTNFHRGMISNHISFRSKQHSGFKCNFPLPLPLDLASALHRIPLLSFHRSSSGLVVEYIVAIDVTRV